MAVASSRVDRVDEVMDFLSCSICLEFFDDPKLLPCHHSFCCDCLQRFVGQKRLIAAKESREIEEFYCPYCVSKFKLKPQEQVADLPSNDFLLKILQVVRPRQGEIGPNCSLCNERLAIIVCEECERVLCKLCYVHDHILPDLQKHSVRSLSEMLDPDQQAKIGTNKLRCALHTNVSPNFYCETCEELICLQCISSKAKINIHTKPDHVCVCVHEVDLKQREALKLTCEAIDGKLTEGKHALQVIDNSTKYHEENANRIKSQIAAQKERVLTDFTEILNEKTQEMIKMVNQEYNPALGKQYSQRERTSGYVKKVERSLGETKSLLEKGNIAELLSAQEEVEENMMLENEREKYIPPELCLVEDFNESMIVEEIDACDILRELLAIEELCKNSAIMKDERKLVTKLRALIGKDFVWTLCYRASRDGWRAQDFHNLCDEKSPTAVLVKVGENIFGGYADKNWQGEHVRKRSTRCFLFSLRNKHKLPPFKCPLIEARYESAICCNPECGAVFGPWGPDLLISDNANANQLSCSNLGKVYQPPPGYEFGTPKTQSLLAGSYNFKPCEIEMFCPA